MNVKGTAKSHGLKHGDRVTIDWDVPTVVTLDFRLNGKALWFVFADGHEVYWGHTNRRFEIVVTRDLTDEQEETA